MLASQLARALFQGLYFVALARGLGITDYGAFAALVAVISLAAPFSSLGTINLAIINLIDGRSPFDRQVATSLALSTAAGAVLTGVLTLITPFVLPSQVDRLDTLLIGLADLVFARWVEVGAFIYQTLRRTVRSAHYFAWVYAARFAVALPLAFYSKVNIRVWSLGYLLATLVFAVPMTLALLRDAGLARPDMPLWRSQWFSGILFSIGLSSQTIYNDIDKAMLARLGSAADNGAYSAAYRIIDLAHTPTRAALGTLYPRFFEAGRQGLRETYRYGRRAGRLVLAYSALASVAIAACASLLEVLLGEQYRSAIVPLRFLAVLPFVKACHYLAADILSGARRQAWRTIVQVAVAVANVLLNLVLIPRYGVAGAVASSLASDVALAVCLWSIIAVNLRRQPDAQPV